MRTLSPQDFDAALTCIREIHNLDSLASFESFAERITVLLHRVVQADLIGCLETSPDPAATAYYFNPPGVASEQTHRVWEHVGHEHAVLANHLRTGDTRFYKISDFLSQQAYRRSALYQELYRRMDVEDVMATFFPLEHSCQVSVALHRDRRSFSERDRLLLNLLQPHIVQAWKNARLLKQLLGELTAVQTSLEALDIGVIALDPSGRIRTMNGKARSYLQTYFPDRNVTREVPHAIAEWLRLQNQGGAGRLPSPPKPLQIRTAHGQLLITNVPRQEGTVLIATQESRAPETTALCGLGLTRREAEIVVWVSQGKTNAAIAGILGISWRTVQKHLEHVFRKLEVDSRTAIATIAWENIRAQMPARSSLRGSER